MPAIVKLRYAINFALACEDAGLDPTRLLQRVQIDGRVLQNPEHMISEHQLWTLAGLAAHATGKFDIGRAAGRISSVADHGALQELFNEKTLFERLVTFCELAKLEYSRADFFVRPSWNGLVFGRKAIDGTREQIRQVELYVLELMLETVRSVLGHTWDPKILNLQSEHHVDLEAIVGSTDVRLRFGQPETEILLDRSEIAIGALAPTQIYTKLHVNTTHAVVALIRTYLFDPRLSLSFVADLLAVSERHLQRELQKDGSSFSQILNRERTKTAMELLKAPDITVSEISRSLGYSNQAHFSRAFRRITGVSPSRFRKVQEIN